MSEAKDDELASARTLRKDPENLRQTEPIAASASSAPDGRRYEIKRELGRGGEGAVYLAFDRHAEQTVALKVLDNVRAGSEALARLRRELGFARRITHHGIVRLYDLVETEGSWALSMEYIDGRSLESRIDSGVPFSVAQITALAHELAEALAAAHAAGVTHRDLKPANVLLRADGSAVISDFGISRTHAAQGGQPGRAPADGSAIRVTQDGALIGTPLYMSPEQLLGRPAGPAADVYSLGLILYEVSTGQVPHADATLDAIIRRRTNEPAPPVASLRPDLPSALAAVIDRCLSLPIAQRFPDGRAIATALKPTAVDPLPRAATSKAPRPWPLVGVGALALGVIAFAGLQLQRPAQPNADASPTAVEPLAPPEPPPGPTPFELRASGHRRVTYGAGCEEFPSFFPDSKRIVFDATTGGRSNLVVMDLDTGKQEQLTESPMWDFAARVSPDGKQVVFLRADRQLLGSYVMDTDGRTAPRLLTPGAIRPSFTPTGKEVWAGSSVRPARIDVATARVIEEVELPGSTRAWHVLELESGDVIKASLAHEGGSGGIAISSGSPGARVWRDLLVDNTEEGLALAPAGTHVIGARKGPNASELVALPMQGGDPVSLAASGIKPGKGISFSADRKRVAWSTCVSRPSAVPMSERGALEPQEWRDLDLARLPDGRLAIISDRDGTLRLWLTDPSGKEAPSSLDAGAGPSQVAASRDGRFLAVTTEDGIRLVEVDGGATRMLTETAGDSDPSFSHDGRHVLFNRRVAGEHQIHRVTLDGHVNATGAKGLAPVSFDATDDFVFFAEGRGTRHPMLWSAARGTAAPLSPTLPAGRYGRLDLSPDGKQLAIPRNGTEVVIVDRASGKIARTLTMAGDELDRSIFAADGSLFALRVRWVGDIWVADLTD